MYRRRLQQLRIDLDAVSENFNNKYIVTLVAKNMESTENLERLVRKHHGDIKRLLVTKCDNDYLEQMVRYNHRLMMERPNTERLASDAPNGERHHFCKW